MPRDWNEVKARWRELGDTHVKRFQEMADYSGRNVTMMAVSSILSDVHERTRNLHNQETTDLISAAMQLLDEGNPPTKNLPN